MRLILAAILAIQAAPTPAERQDAALKKFGERTYRIQKSGNDLGAVVLRSKGDRKEIVLEAEFKIKAGEGEMAMTFAETTDPNGLKFRSARRSGTTPSGKKESTVTVKDGKAILKDGDDESTFTIGKETVGDLAPFWLLCAAEQKKDATLKLDVLNLMMPGYEPGHAFTCVGPETVEVGGRKYETFKWVEKGEWKHTMKISGQDRELESKVDNTYWVSAEGYLVKFTSGSTEMTLVTK